MKAVVMYSPGDTKIIDMEKPKPQKGEVLIKVKESGVCGTDYMLYKGKYYANFPIIFGHEYSGEIAEIGEEVQQLKVGDKVTVDPNIVCHNCYFCRIGQEHLCENLITLGIHKNGGFAEYSTVPVNNVYKLADNLSFQDGALAEPLACSIRGIELANIHPGDTVLIIGAGCMGNLVMQLASNAGAANIIISEPSIKRREIAMEYGATYSIDPFKQDLEKEVKKIKYCGADVVFECSGNSKAVESTLHLVRRGGYVIWFGVSPKGETIPITPFNINENEITICGSFNNSFTQTKAIELLASKRIKIEKLINPKIPIEDFNKVWEIFGSEDTMRIMITIK